MKATIAQMPVAIFSTINFVAAAYRLSVTLKKQKIRKKKHTTCVLL